MARWFIKKETGEREKERERESWERRMWYYALVLDNCPSSSVTTAAITEPCEDPGNDEDNGKDNEDVLQTSRG